MRALALMVVVFGHWLATLPRLEGGELIATDHLLDIWDLAGALTWIVQVVPLFVFVSAAVSADGVTRRLAESHSQLTWWGGRALQLARPTATYMAALTLFAGISLYTGGRLLGPFSQSLTIHLWFLIMLLGVQAFLPLSVRAYRRFGLGAVIGLVVLAIVAGLVADHDVFYAQWH
ncbi:MAG: acyltransferase family protein, partial [Wenzhouxiangella sp.]